MLCSFFIHNFVLSFGQMQFRALIICCTAFVAAGTLYTVGDDDYYNVDQQQNNIIVTSKEENEKEDQENREDQENMRSQIAGEQDALTQEDQEALGLELVNKLLDYVKPQLSKFVRNMFKNETDLEYTTHNASCAYDLSSCHISLDNLCLLNPPGVFREETKCLLEIGNLLVEVSSLKSGLTSELIRNFIGYDFGGYFKVDKVQLTKVGLSAQSYKAEVQEHWYSQAQTTNFGSLQDVLNKTKDEKGNVKQDTEVKDDPEQKQKDGTPTFKVTGYVGVKDFNIALRTSWIGSWLGDKHADEVQFFDEKGECQKIADLVGLCKNSVRNEKDPQASSIVGVIWNVLKFLIAGDVSKIAL